jgi:hypothetical protein
LAFDIPAGEKYKIQKIMCIATFLQVKKICGDKAEMSDGRIIKLDGKSDFKKGDYLEVYADLAVGKVSASFVKEIKLARNPKIKQEEI